MTCVSTYSGPKELAAKRAARTEEAKAQAESILNKRKQKSLLNKKKDLVSIRMQETAAVKNEAMTNLANEEITS